MDPGRGRCRGARRGRRARRDPEEARDPAQLPGHRAPAVPARAVRPRAAPVHRHLERRGAPVQPRPAQLGLRLVEGREHLLRVRHRQRRGEPRGLPDHQAPHLRRPGRTTGRHAGEKVAMPMRQGARRAARPGAGVPPRVGRQHLRHELRRRSPATPIEALNRGAALAGCLQNTGEGGALAVPPQRRRPGLPDRYVVLRLPGRATAASTWPGSRTSSRRRPCAPWRSSCRRAPSPGWAGCCRPRR